MKGKNFSIAAQRIKYVAMDFVMASLAFLLFDIFRFHEFSLVEKHYVDLWSFLASYKLILEQIFVPCCIVLLHWLSGYYNRPFDKSRLTEFNTTLMTTLVSTIILFLALLINDTTGVKIKDYETILVLFGLQFTLTYSGRWLLTMRTINHLRRHNWIYSTLIVGNSAKSREIYCKLKNSGSVWAYNVVGFINLAGESSVTDSMPSWEIDDIELLCKEKNIDQIILAPEKIHDAQIIEILNRLFPLGIPVKIAPDTLSYITGNIHLNDILGVPMIDLTSPRISEFQKNVKRTFDVVISILALIILSPIYLFAAIRIKMTSEGPIIYKQERIGKGRKAFNIYKFRSMRVDAEKSGPQLSSEKDTRITPFGAVMRKYRIDELPQFWNVLKGDMSFVGPRPERQYFIDQIIKEAPYYGLIFQVRPGITSWGMVKYGYASSVSEMVERSRYDLLYLNNMSISTDLKIIIYTVKTVINGEGM